MQIVFPSINNDSIGRTWSIGTCGWQKKAARAVNDRNNKKINGIHTNSFIFFVIVRSYRAYFNFTAAVTTRTRNHWRFTQFSLNNLR